MSQYREIEDRKTAALTECPQCKEPLVYETADERRLCPTCNLWWRVIYATTDPIFGPLFVPHGQVTERLNH